ncbi:MAG TPA: response regulator [Kofleriaceae bacterium]|nr:response regulator [Kofleriaceae bacterium]
MSTQALIVCVDDDAEVARTVAKSLKRVAWAQSQVMSTTEPEEALEWVLDNEVAVLLSDVEMPLMNGIELAERVKQLRPSTVRILMTGHVTADAAMNGINKGGVFRFVAKPFAMADLETAVRDGVALHRELSAVAVERDQVVRRGRLSDDHELRFPSLTMPARAHDGAYVVRRTTVETLSGLGLDALLALRRRAK